MATQNTHFRLILCLILRGGRVALVSPNLRRDMLPWSKNQRNPLGYEKVRTHPKSKGTKSEVKTYAGGHHDAPRNKAWIQRLSRFPQ